MPNHSLLRGTFQCDRLKNITNKRARTEFLRAERIEKGATTDMCTAIVAENKFSTFDRYPKNRVRSRGEGSEIETPLGAAQCRHRSQGAR